MLDWKLTPPPNYESILKNSLPEIEKYVTRATTWVSIKKAAAGTLQMLEVFQVAEYLLKEDCLQKGFFFFFFFLIGYF